MNVETTLRKANNLLKRGDTAKAALLYQSILNQYPENKAAIKALGKVNLLPVPSQINPVQPSQPNQHEIDSLLELLNAGQLEAALITGSSMALQFPSSELIFNLLGVIYFNLNRPDDALKSYRKALHLQPTYVQAHSNIGNVYDAIGDYTNAIDCYKKAIQLDPNYAQAYANLSNIFNKISLYPVSPSWTVRRQTILD